MKKYIILIVALILTGCSSSKQYSTFSPSISGLSTPSGVIGQGSSEFCPGVITIYDKRYFGSDIQSCTTSSGEPYLMVEMYGIEGGSGRNFFDIQGNELGKIEQYGDGDGSVPDFPTITGKIFDGSCDMVELSSCGIIDLVGSYRGRRGLLTGSRYAQSCEQTFKKLELLPEHRSDEAYEMAHRYMMCTDDRDVFYIGFTGNKIGNNRSASYQNYDTIQFYTLEGDELGYTSQFMMQTDGDQLLGIDILANESPDRDIFMINRCIYLPIDDCYER